MSNLNRRLQEKTDDYTAFADILKDLQAHILKHHKKKFGLFSLITFHPKSKEQKRKAKDWIKSQDLNSALYQLTTKPSDISSISCLYLSMAGYSYFEEEAPEHEEETTFRTGLMKNTIFKEEHRRREVNYRKDVHLLYMIASDDLDALETKKEKIRSEINHDLGHVFFEQGRLYRNEKEKVTKEWFGYRDGISNPRFFRNKNVKNRHMTTNNSPLDLALVEQKGGGSLACGSYLVFLKLEQNTDAFLEASKLLATKLAPHNKKKTEKELIEYAGALMIGRHTNGTPLITSESPGKISDEFDYEGDFDGVKCPLHAHIRKANPRECLSQQIVRRSMLYGDENASKKGLLFMSFQRDLRSQFEDLVNRGIYSYTHKQRATGIDAIFSGKNDSGYQQYPEVYGKKSKILIGRRNLESLITFRGGWYFFAPSISYLQSF